MLRVANFLSSRQKRRNPPQGGKASTEGRFQAENLIEKLEESRIGAANRKGQRSERSQEVIENKARHFFHSLQSQEVPENKGVIFVKPRGC